MINNYRLMINNIYIYTLLVKFSMLSKLHPSWHVMGLFKRNVLWWVAL